MKTFPLAFIALTSIASAQNYQILAVKKYPELERSDSALNKKFLEIVTEKKKSEVSFFRDADWPLRAAKLAASAIPKVELVQNAVFEEKLPELFSFRAFIYNMGIHNVGGVPFEGDVTLTLIAQNGERWKKTFTKHVTIAPDKWDSIWIETEIPPAWLTVNGGGAKVEMVSTGNDPKTTILSLTAPKKK